MTRRDQEAMTLAVLAAVFVLLAVGGYASTAHGQDYGAKAAPGGKRDVEEQEDVGRGGPGNQREVRATEEARARGERAGDGGVLPSGGAGARRCSGGACGAEAGDGGDERRRGDLGDEGQLTLARAAVAECGWSRVDCHAAVWHMLDNRRQLPRTPLAIDDMAHRYCSVWKPVNDDNVRARWVRTLPAVEVDDGDGGDVRDVGRDDDARAVPGGGIDGTVVAAVGDWGGDGHNSRHGVGRVHRRPAGWPPTASWPRHLPLWRVIYKRAGAFLRGEIANPCNGAPLHMDGPMDDGARRLRGYRVLACGDTGRQTFRGWGR